MKYHLAPPTVPGIKPSS